MPRRGNRDEAWPKHSDEWEQSSWQTRCWQDQDWQGDSWWSGGTWSGSRKESRVNSDRADTWAKSTGKHGVENSTIDAKDGEYVLGKTIGEGTFGKVKVGTHILTGERVAVKILERERLKEFADVERVAREIHILKIIRHPHIIKLHEIIETPEQLFLIMEYCNGGELFDHIVAQGRLPEPEACKFLQQIVGGLEQIHKINVVHRDLKPENLLLDEHKNIKIVDFGLSNIFRDGQLLKTACGSPCYAAPEMIADKWYVPSQCDVWSCGVILFALVCGFLPFEDPNHSDLYRKILAADYTIPKFVSSDARHLIESMLTIDPEKRVTTAGIRKHQWYKQIPDAAAQWDDADTLKLDPGVLRQLESLGISRGIARKSLLSNEHNTATTTYNLLLQSRCNAGRDGSNDGGDEQHIAKAGASQRQRDRGRKKGGRH